VYPRLLHRVGGWDTRHNASRATVQAWPASNRCEKAGRLQDLPINHSPKFLPPLQPILRTGTEALFAAALAWLSLDKD
jgi:hypothetical protein